jgi:MoaA/NifB/PqqE/SkfB family radical SAM enzyme/SAM-dependent methyltransferase
MMEINDRTVLYAPTLSRFERDGMVFFIDGDAPNWIGTDARGAWILLRIVGRSGFGDLVRDYAHAHRVDLPKAYLHVHEFVRSAVRAGMVSDRPVEVRPYPGRAGVLRPERLREFWFHTNNSCNLTCAHCLVSSHPGGDPGLTTDQIKRLIDETHALGVYRFYFTGGEPFLRKDIFDLIEYVTKVKQAELIILTNATLFRDGRLELLSRQDRKRLFLQVSLDGATPEINDPLRGEGTFAQIVSGLKAAAGLGFNVSVTAVATRENIEDLLNLPSLAASFGARSIHLMWPHRRGRMLETMPKSYPDTKQLIELVRAVKQRADEKGLLLDNTESVAYRVNGLPGVKYDLGNACWDSLCAYDDGHLYPSASFAGHPAVDLGDALRHPVKSLWLDSPIAQRFREASILHKPGLKGDPFRYLTGGGDIEHAHFYSEGLYGIGDLSAEDPYYPLTVEMVKDAMEDLVRRKREALNTRSGYTAPVIFHAMGDGAIACGDDVENREAATLHSNCVLSFDVEKPHRIIQEFYGNAAEQPQKELCCPVNYEAEDIAHIPQEVLERFYGCGSPVTLADLKEGETHVDLGSGGGIDCFIAAKRVGREGRVIGVDMTDRMLEVANRNRARVAENLGYDTVEFRKGFLERIPVEEASVDLITSNCVINLSPDKRSVFSEMWRILKDHGRIVVSDIVSDRPTPPHIKVNPQLWGECLAGALTEEEFLAELERAGFYGLEVLKKTYWKEVEGYPFYSVTVRGYKHAKKAGCVYIGQKAVYRGPFKTVMDEEGHLFPRDIAIEVCTDTASKLRNAPYAAHFTVTDPDQEKIEIPSVAATQSSQNCGPGCC